MMTILATLFWISMLAIVYVYQGYRWVLELLCVVRSRNAVQLASQSTPLSITVLLTVHNEELKIERRVRNILECDYPPERIEVMIASDGSTDQTEEIVEALSVSLPVRLFRSGGQSGKTETQNRAIPAASGEIIVFTDADTVFARDYLIEIVAPFADPTVGCVTAGLRFQQSDNSVSENQGFYWNYELKLRELESRLGILAVASGQAMAVRKSLLKPMPAHVGEDCVLPLEIVRQGYSVRHQTSARAYDVLENEPEREFNTRVRMTLRNWVGTWLYCRLLNPITHPDYAFALWSHKLLRWLSPLFVLTATMTTFALINYQPYRVFSWLAALFYMSAAVGWFAGRCGTKIPVASTIFSFVLANVGFLIGLLKALSGHKVVAYRSGALEKQADE
jgi:cellulose synthase/poly-beta-1,6-N-acetylglucosamine synthase-like glycosyltransferase